MTNKNIKDGYASIKAVLKPKERDCCTCLLLARGNRGIAPHRQHAVHCLVSTARLWGERGLEFPIRRVNEPFHPLKTACAVQHKAFYVQAVTSLAPVNGAIQLLTNCVKRRIFFTRISANSHKHSRYADYYAFCVGSTNFILNSVNSMFVELRVKPFSPVR